MRSIRNEVRGASIAMLVAASVLGAGSMVGCVPAPPAKPDLNDAGVGGSSQGTDAGAGGLNGNGGSDAAAGAMGGQTGTGGVRGTGGAGGAGTPGTGGQTGGQGGAIVVPPNPCTAADPGNEDRTHATPYPTLGAAYQACIQSGTDIDYYQVTTPAAPADGGVLTVNLIDVGPNGTIFATAFVASDNGEIEANGAAAIGTSAYFWFNAAAATTYHIAVKGFYPVTTANPYTFKTTFTPVNDTYEPNDLRTQAAAVAVGTPVQAFMFAGYTVSTGFAANAWEDWYKVTLAAGTLNVTLGILANDVAGSIQLYDSLGSSITTMGSSTSGSTVVLNRTGITAGDYYLKIEPFYEPRGSDDGNVLPQYVSQPYTLTITQ